MYYGSVSPTLFYVGNLADSGSLSTSDTVSLIEALMKHFTNDAVECSRSSDNASDLVGNYIKHTISKHLTSIFCRHFTTRTTVTLYAIATRCLSIVSNRRIFW